jgi:predicted DNA-binding ArsR family transcriptional regulator
MTKREISDVVGEEGVGDCLLILKKGNLLEEKWRMPAPGQKPEKEFKATYSKFRANFQCNFSDLADLLSIALAGDDEAGVKGVSLEGELSRGNTSINDIARRFGVTPIYIKGVAKRVPHLDVKGQGLVVLEE